MNKKVNLITKPICIGTGLVALDVIISSISHESPKFLAGGSCGNVLTILSYLGWSAYPIARLSNNVATELLLQDLRAWEVNDDLLSFNESGSTPIIIHRILKNASGIPKHRFEFRNPEDGKYLPSYKPCLAKSVDDIYNQKTNPQVFYFDRINRASIELAKLYKRQGAIIFFEPSSIKDIKGFKECLEVADVLKFSQERIANYKELYPEGKAELEIQTLGDKGLLYRRRNDHSWKKLTGFKINNIKDAAGAGDWCTSGIILNLFRNGADISTVNNTEIIFALQFGQALSTLNCTYEGARGLMYNIKPAELIHYISHIISSNNNEIHQPNQSTIYQVKNSGLTISSLYAHV